MAIEAGNHSQFITNITTNNNNREFVRVNQRLGGVYKVKQPVVLIMFMLLSLTVVKVIAPASGPEPAAYTQSTPSDIVHLHKDYYHFGPFSTFSLVLIAIFTAIVIWVVLVIWAVLYVVHCRSQNLQLEAEMMHM